MLNGRESLLMINYAHRGASEFYPENTLYSFYMGLEMKANGIETDIQRTRDGVLVLFHDDTMKRILGLEGSIRDYSYAELLQMDFGIYKGKRFANEKIVTLEEFLIHFGAKDVQLALEIKQYGIEKEVLAMIDRYEVRNKTIVTSFHWDSIADLRALDSEIRLGYLARQVDDELLQKLVSHRIWQLCPKAIDFTDDMNQKARALGLSVRFWGISSEEAMLKGIRMGVDGMTMNNPAALCKALEK